MVVGRTARWLAGRLAEIGGEPLLYLPGSRNTDADPSIELLSKQMTTATFTTLPPYQRPFRWLHATQPEHASLRAWLEDQLARIDAAVVNEFVSLRDASRYTQALAELAAGSVLRQPGYSVVHSPQLNGLTPVILGR